MESYLDTAIIVDQTLFGLDKDENIVYYPNEHLLVGNHCFYEVVNYPVGELQRLFELGYYKIFLFRNYERRGVAVNLHRRKEFIKNNQNNFETK